MKAFNAVQLVLAFVAFPFGIAWLQSQEFTGSTAALYLACIFYIVFVVMICRCVYIGIEEFDKWQNGSDKKQEVMQDTLSNLSNKVYGQEQSIYP